MYTGELISLGVAVSWTVTALFFEYAGKRMGSLSLNFIRLVLSILMLGVTLLIFTGQAIPFDAGREAWLWLGISGFIGYIIGDYCLFNAYIVIGSRFGQLFMTLAPPSAALAGMLILGEKMGGMAILGMFVTLSGIGLSVIGRGADRERGNETKKWEFKLPLKGILFGTGAGVGQGVGLVFSKLGMEDYMLAIDSQDTVAVFMAPFASTQIRAIVGASGFFIIILITKSLRRLFRSLNDVKAMGASTGGTFFGPFIGVSFSLMAVQYTEAGTASTLMALTPILILVPSYFFFKQKVSLKEAIGAIISVIGVSLFFL
ncbi:MAG: DMT family transporter [Tannerellaceae bacterium]|jgi:drug/metabolite transporter (DMT)-like permease|nr:DMT family transporter [Tannerellaceae bacterium]